MSKTQAERIAALETQMEYIKQQLAESNKKLDNLLELRYKGAGAFWLASALFGTSLIGFVSAILGWWK